MIINKLGGSEELDEKEFDVLLLDGVQLGELQSDDKAFLERFTNAKTLSLSYTGLKSLKNLPVLPALEMIDVSDNCLTGEDLSSIYYAFKRIKSIVISNNAIRNLEHLS